MHLGGTEFFSSWVIMLLIERYSPCVNQEEVLRICSVPLSQQKGSSPVLSQQIHKEIRIVHLFPTKTSQTWKIQDKCTQFRNPNNLKFALM